MSGHKTQSNSIHCSIRNEHDLVEMKTTVTLIAALFCVVCLAECVKYFILNKRNPNLTLLATIYSKALLTPKVQPTEGNDIDWSTHADDSTLLAILDYSPLDHLFEYAKISLHYRDQILNEYILRLYHVDEQTISLNIADSENTFIAIAKTGVRISNGLNDTISTIQQFGHIFKHFKVLVRDNAHAREFSRNMETYCLQATYDITLERHSNHSIDFWFPYAHHVTIQYVNNFVDQIDLRILFPQMQHLEIANTDHQPWFEYNFFLLTELAYYPQTADANAEHLKHLLEQNPQIRSIRSSLLWDSECLQMVSEQLPNLETLSIEFQPAQRRSDHLTRAIRFANVRTFSLKLVNFTDAWNSDARKKLANIQFDRLQTFTLASDITARADGWVELIGRNSKLTNVQTQLFEMGHADLLRLFELVKLERLTIDCFDYGKVLDTVWFMRKKSNTLKELTVHTNDEGRENFLAELPSGWKVDGEYITSNHVCLVLVRE